MNFAAKRESPLMPDTIKPEHRVHRKQFIEIYLWMLRKGSAYINIWRATVFIVTRRVIVQRASRNLLYFFFLIHDALSRATSRKQECRVSCAHRSREDEKVNAACATYRHVISWLTRPHFPRFFHLALFPFYLAQAHRVPRKPRVYTEIRLGVTCMICVSISRDWFSPDIDANK